jgi:hypothetical protein
MVAYMVVEALRRLLGPPESKEKTGETDKQHEP